MPRTIKLVLVTLTFAVLCLASAGVANADPIVNGSFETPSLPTNSFQYNPSGATWVFVGNSGIINPPGGAFLGQPAPNGSQYAFLQTGGGPTGVASSFSQSITLSAGQYTLSFFDAGRPSGNPAITGNLAYQVFLGSTPIYTGATTTGQPFTLRSTIFTVTSAGTYNFSFFTPLQLNVDNTAFFDAISITPSQTPPSAVPEPTTMLLLGTGLVGIAAKVRKRRKAADSSN